MAVTAGSIVKHLDVIEDVGAGELAGFVDALQAAYGVSNGNVFVKSFTRKSGDGPWQAIANTFIPDAGYTRFDTNGLTVNYVSHVQS